VLRRLGRLGVAGGVIVLDAHGDAVERDPLALPHQDAETEAP